MDLSLFYSVLLTLFLCFKGIFTFEVNCSPAQTLLLGDGGFTLQCSFSISPASPYEELREVNLTRKRPSQTDFEVIVKFFPPRANLSAQYLDESLTNRSVATKPEPQPSTGASVTFSDIRCSDLAVYKWVIKYYSTVENEQVIEKKSEVKVKVHGTFETGQPEYGIISVTPGYDVMEGTNITIRCKAEVGAEPQGQLEWYYYEQGSTNPNLVSDMAVKGPLVPITDKNCSFTQESTLTLSLDRDLNNMVVRCTLQQDVRTADGDDHRQTSVFNVSYSPSQPTITSNPSHPVYSEGETFLTLTCLSDANPPATYKWLLPDGSEVMGSTYTLQDLQINNTGNYTCVAKNGIPNDNYTHSHTVEVVVAEKTTPTTTTTTTTTPSTTAPKNNTTKSGSAADSEPQTDQWLGVLYIVLLMYVSLNLFPEKATTTITTPTTTPPSSASMNTTTKSGELRQRLPWTEDEVQASSLIGAPIGGVLGIAVVLTFLVVAWKKRLLKDFIFKKKKQWSGLTPPDRLGPRGASLRTYENLRKPKQSRQQKLDRNRDVYYNIAAKQVKAQQQYHTDGSNTESEPEERFTPSPRYYLKPATNGGPIISMYDDKYIQPRPLQLPALDTQYLYVDDDAPKKRRRRKKHRHERRDKSPRQSYYEPDPDQEDVENKYAEVLDAKSDDLVVIPGKQNYFE